MAEGERWHRAATNNNNTDGGAVRLRWEVLAASVLCGGTDASTNNWGQLEGTLHVHPTSRLSASPFAHPANSRPTTDRPK